MTALLANYTELIRKGWDQVFAQSRTLHRAIEQALTIPMVIGRRTISRIVCCMNRSEQDWTADYKLFSRSQWESKDLFTPVLQDYLSEYERGPVVVAYDDTVVGKSGRKVPGASWQRDPMSPPFRVNLKYGLRFLQAGLIFPCYRRNEPRVQSIPIRFQYTPVLKKPGKRATPEEKQRYREQKKIYSLSAQAVGTIRETRLRLDEEGATHRNLLAVVDGSYCNRTMFGTRIDRVEVLARCRKDAKLCFPAEPGSRRRYAEEVFTPEEIRKDDRIPWRRMRFFYAGKMRWIRYKVVEGVLWRRGARLRRLRLIVIAPQPYKPSPNARASYRQPSFLLTTDLNSSIRCLIQAYLDRWQIEVNFRDEKTLLGIGDAQLWSPLSVPRYPEFVVATYSLMWLAALKTFGSERSVEFMPLPKWRKDTKRYSTLDLLTKLRNEINETQNSEYFKPNFRENLVSFAYG